ncbi:MAG: AsmA family protein [Holophagae bacterium]|jgi:AsmA protein
MKKKIVVLLAVFAALFVVAVAALFMLVDADDFRGFIEAKAEESLGRDVKLGAISLSVVPTFGLEVKDVAVAAAPGEDAEELASVASVRLGARLRPLLQKRLEITSIEVVKPAVNLVRDAGGRWNFELATEARDDEAAAESGQAPEVAIDSITISDAQMRLRDESRPAGQPLEITLTELDMAVAGIGSDELVVAVDGGLLDVADAALGADPVRLEIGAVDVTVLGGGDSVTLTRAELEVGKTPVAFSGAIVKQGAGRRIDLDLEPTRIAVSDIASLIASATGGLDVDLEGPTPIEIEGGVHGVLAENSLPDIDAKATISRLTVGAEALAKPVTDINAVATWRGTEVAINGFSAKVGASDVSGTVQLAMSRRPSLRFALESQRADLGELLGLMGSEEAGEGASAPPDPDSFLVRSTASGSLLVGEGSWHTLRFSDLEARLRLENGVATLEPVSMALYDGSFNGRLASDLKQVPPSFEFAGEAEKIDMNPFVDDQTGMSDILMGRFTGRVTGAGAGSDAESVIQSLEGRGVARIADGQVGRLDVLRSVGQVAGVLGQKTLANLASESATGATRFSRLAGDFQISGGVLTLERSALESTAFDLTGNGVVNMLSSAMNGEFQLAFSPEVSRWMVEEGTRAAELFLDSKSGRVVLPLGLSGTFDDLSANVDWGSAAQTLVTQTVERELDNVLGGLLGGGGDDKPASGASGTTVRIRRAEADSGRFALELIRSGWAGDGSPKNFTLRCRVDGGGVEKALVRAVDAEKKELEKKTINVADRLKGADTPEFGARISGTNLHGAAYPVVVSVKAIGADGQTARVVVAIERPAG